MHKALQKDPAQRFPSMQSMAAALGEVATAIERMTAVSTRRDNSGRVRLMAQRVLDEERRERNKRFLGGAAILSVCLAATIGGLALVKWRRAPVEGRSLLVVTSMPAGARVTVDGRTLGETTPAALRDLSAGRHEVRIEKVGYAAVERTVTTAEADRAAIDVSLPPETRRVEVQTTPDGASLYVDGHLVPGTTPTTVALTIDDFHELRAEREGYETMVRALKPEDHDPAVTLALSPERHPRGTLVVEAQDVAEVWLDGVQTGLTTPTLGFHVATGEHTIELRTSAGERSLSKRVHVAQGQTLRVTMALAAGKTP
jgi:hypothetical protein